MKLTSKSFADQQFIPQANAFGKIDSESHIALAGNRNPHLAWVDAPEGTKSFVVVCHDPDVPSKGDDVNQEGREVPASTVGSPALVSAHTGVRHSPSPPSRPPAARPLTKVRLEVIECMPIQVRQLNGSRLGFAGCQQP